MHIALTITHEAFKETYAATVYPLGNPSTWEVPDELQGMHVDPPSPKNPTGRPENYKNTVTRRESHQEKMFKMRKIRTQPPNMQI
ncbi:hypothetical protein TIFTF001_022560 [Ficus carica]|uniref:Uncharacterized protein n=1 Tax=Ficus carica TaxID=3494 RepID=A0AA88AVZ1_FICCA|nr:hypothetical protein TIFTF001_022560 [Ficus carica]